MKFTTAIKALVCPIALAMLPLSTAQAALPSYWQPGWFNPDSYSFTASENSDIIAYFAGGTAEWVSTLGLRVNGIDSLTTGLPNNSTAVGTSFNLGKVNAGDTYTFFIKVADTGDTFYSQKSLNSDDVQHVWSTDYAGGDYGLPKGTYVGFEDWAKGGDRDYNDLTFVFNAVPSIAAAPEPATWLMMILGFGLVGHALRRKRAPTATQRTALA